MDEQSEPWREKDSSQGLLQPKLSSEGTQPGGLPGSGTTRPPAAQKGIFGLAQHLPATTEANFGPGYHWAITGKQEQRENSGGC